MSGGIQPAVDVAQNAVDVIDKGIDTIAVESSSWQEVLLQIVEDVPDELRETIRSDIQSLINRSIAQAGVEFRCDVDFVAARVIEGLEVIKAKLRNEAPPALRPAICQVDPLSVDLNNEASSRTTIVYSGYNFDLSDSAGQLPCVALVTESGTGPCASDVYLSRLTHYQMVLNIAESNGLPIGSDTGKITLSWNDTLLSEVPVVQKLVPAAPATKTETVTLNKIITYKPPHTGGDRDFGGHGPKVTLKAELRIGSGGVTLEGRVTMDAIETKSDFTRANGTSGWEQVYKAPTGWRITGFALTPDEVETEYTDTDHAVDSFGGFAWLESWEVTGDTDGDEAGSDTKVVAHFTGVAGITLEEIP